ncbi:MAG TPA: GTPase HflX, partial [Sphingomicrobium sp.]|nr:GTPase HflX [Sphingomicrobium sp.]
MSGFGRASDDGISRGARALLVLPDRNSDANARTSEARLDEAAGLAAAIGIDVVGRRTFRIRQPRPSS